MLRKALLYIILFLFSILFAAAPKLTTRDVKIKINEILKDHVIYRALNEELVERILRNFIEQLDPLKTYFLEPEIVEWLFPSDELKKRILDRFRKNDYSEFSKIYDLMLKAIDRREKIESTIENTQLPQVVSIKELKQIEWTQSQDELTDKILKIKALQLEAADKLKDETREKFTKRIKKRRLNREAKLQKSSKDNQKSLILSYVLKAVASSLDAHTNYLTPQEATQLMIQIQQKLSGIGAILRDDLNGIVVAQIIAKGPAAKSGKLKIKDRIIAVDDRPIVGMEITEAVELIRGEKGSNVTLTIIRGEKEKIDITITRDEVILEDTRLESSYQPYGDGIIAHLHLGSFYQNKHYSSAEDIKNTLEKLKLSHNLKGVIFDLRNNTGGLLSQAVEVTGLFISKGIVVSIKDNTGNIKHLRDRGGKITWDGPLLVLTNRASASASEIVAQSLKDYGRAIVVGDEKTFGKGSFQTFTLDHKNAKISPKGEHKVTRGLYYSVSGKSPQLVGVSADIVAPGILSNLDIGEEYEKAALKPDSIEPNFEDDLSDIPYMYKQKVSLLYKNNLQPILTKYKKYIDVLNDNSKKRIEKNKNYQSFLQEIAKENFSGSSVDLFGQSDLQLLETYNIMKDLIFFLECREKLALSY